MSADWETDVIPWRNRQGIESDTEFTIVAINRRRGWVQRIERQTTADVERFDPDAAWARGLERAG